MFSSCKGSKNENKVKIKRDLSVNGKPIERGEVVTSRCHGSTISGSPQTVVFQIRRKDEKTDMHDFPLHDCTQAQNGSHYFSSIVRQCKWSSLSRKIVEIQKFSSHGNVTSHFSSL